MLATIPPVLDYHLHMLRHGEDGPYRASQVREYAREAGRRGVGEIAVTEHLFRFVQADRLLGSWWNADPDSVLRGQTAGYWAAHATGDLDGYVTAVLDAAADPGSEGAAEVRLGLEVDYYPGKMDDVAKLLAGYPFDLLLGSVHWLGAWGFDQLEDPAVMASWSTRRLEDVWDGYVTAVEELAASRTCDVLAHLDVVKVAGGRPPGDPSCWYDRLATAAATHGLCVEVSSAGWRKPVGEVYPAGPLLDRLLLAGVGITTASDAHEVELVGDGMDRVRSLLLAAGCESLAGFRARRREVRALS